MQLRMKMLAVVAALILPVALRADEKPAIIVKMKSVEGLLADVRYIAKLAGQEEALKQAEGILDGFKGKEGLGGIDIKRPIGMYATITAGLQDSSVVVLVPIADEKAFIEFLGNFMIKAEKGDDGIYTIDNIPNAPIPLTVYFRFENKYAYVTLMEKGNIDKKKLLAPEKVLAGAADEVLSASVKLGELPDVLKQIVLTQVENAVAEVKEKKGENEPPAVTKLRETAADMFLARIKDVINDGEEVSLKLKVDTKADDIAVDFWFKPKAGSQLAKDMESAGKGTSLFTGLAGKDDAVSFLASVVIPEQIRKAMVPAIEAGIKDALAQEKDENKKALMKKAFDAVMPTLKAGEIDAAVSVRGPDKNGHITAVAGIKIAEGKGVEAFVREVVKIVPEKDKDKIMLDAASAGDVKIHKIVAEDMDAEAKKVLGSTSVYFAIRDDAALVAFGADGLSALKEAIAIKGGTNPALLSVAVSVARVAAMNPMEAEKANKAVKDVFGGSPNGADLVTVSAEMKDGLRVKINVKAKVISLGAKIAGIDAGDK